MYTENTTYSHFDENCEFFSAKNLVPKAKSVFGVYWNMKTLYSLHKMSVLAFKMPRCLHQNKMCYFLS